MGSAEWVWTVDVGMIVGLREGAGWRKGKGRLEEGSGQDWRKRERERGKIGTKEHGRRQSETAKRCRGSEEEEERDCNMAGGGKKGSSRREPAT